MIKFQLDGIIGIINEDFELMMEEGNVKNLVLKDMEVYFKDYGPEKGDPFLNYASHMKILGAKIIKAEQTKYPDGVVF